MQRMALTALAIEKKHKPKATMYRVADDGGLCLEITPSGGKLWRWRYYFNGKPQMLALGKYPTVGLTDARRKRDEARILVESGKHPTREKKTQKLRSAIAGENTFERVARNWMAVKEKGLNKKYHKQSIKRLERHVFPMIGDLPISEITIPDVVRVIEANGKRGTLATARWIKQAIRQVFRFASLRGMCQFNPAADMRDLLPSEEKTHHACIPPSEFPQLLRDMKSCNADILTKSAMHLLALTFVRTGELIGATWQEVDFNRAEWHIPKERMKMRRPHIVPLSRQAIEILKTLHAVTGEKPHVFHSQRGKTKHISNGAVLMALRRMGYQGRMTGHGFRALASSILNEKNYKPDVIEIQLAHQDGNKTRSAYSYHAEYMLERKKMMQDYADYLDELKNQSGKVVLLDKLKGKSR
jgi:integrase